MNYSEQEIVAGCVRNERFFQELLYKRYFSVMMNFCMRYTNDRDEAMQILNNGFLRVFQKLNTFSFRGSLEGWIRRIVFHAVSDYFKGHSKQLRFLELEDRDDLVHDDANSNLYFEDLLRIVEMLPPATKEVFYLYAIEGMSHGAIAAHLSISEGTSKWHLNAARKQLRVLIEQQHKVTSHAN
jgi:RNA polymerase sigma-70 factor (ECF subfamily)